MQIIKYISYIAFGFLLMSCGEDFFDSMTEIEIPEHEPELVVRANFNPIFGEQNGYFLRLSHSLGILDTTEFQLVDDAIITLLEDNILKTSFISDENNDWYYTEPMTLLAGKEYTLRATSPTYGNIEGTQRLPSKGTIINATYEADAAVDIYGERGDEVTIEFQDPAGEENYYVINVWASHQIEGPDTSYLSDNFWVYTTPVDPLIEDLGQLYLTDASFDGETFTTRIRIELIEAGSWGYEGATNLAAEKITVELTSISKDKYLFEKTVSAYIDNDGNPFAEPVVIHENIEGGSGIFTLSVTDKFKIDL